MNEKIEMLDKQLNKTGVIITEDDKIVVSNQKEIIEEDLEKIDWRKDLLEKENNPIDEEIDLIREDFKIKNNSLKRVDGHIKNINKDFLNLRQEIFQEISEDFLFNIPSIEQKIDKVLKIYDSIQEGLLNEPPSTKNSDPLTPLDQNFVTVDELNNHYKLFINRIQEQIATVGGGGEYRFQYLDGIVGIATNSSAYNGKYLQWNSATNKAEFVAVSGGAGSQTLNQTLGFGNTSSLGMSVGIITATEFYGDGSGLTNLPGGGTNYWSQTSAGINTLSNVGIGTTNSILALTVVGDGFFTGVVSIGTTNIPSTLIVDGDIYVSGTVSTDGLFVNDVGIFSSSSLIVANQSGTYGYIIAGDEITDNYTLKFPTITSDTGIAVTGIAQTFTALQTFNNGIKVGVNTSQGLILTSPNGTKYRLIVDNSGALDTVLVP
jgi:hypothetical protein